MTQENAATEISAQQRASNIVPFFNWLGEMGKSRATGHISRDVIAEFERRAVSGELSRDIRPGVEE
jgi:hypothetical protein